MIESLDIPLIVLFSPTYYGKAELSSMKEEMRILGDVFKQRDKALKLYEYLNETETMVRNRTKNIKEKPTVLYFGLKKEDYIEAEKAIEMVNIADISDKPVTALSGGQRQLTLIARSIAQNAPVMILDEPTSALDFNNQITIWKILKKLAETGKLIIACSHDPNHILWFAENTLVIKNGEILVNGKTDDVITNSLLKEIYGIEYNILHNDNSKIIQPVL